ncbi:Clp protease N-terminal domain-containing protein [Nocardiopsis sp. JB363]|uniref:Clp protease N-terminal domain-containing protein n=1 Tax=Nocardiopsis sp. JB363 TaxID=1434837 RepID=UPI00097A6B71|nr:Clp protease N-terminal domain-containing protein [Nocardiopsis sp. JB363]SIO84694.1 ATP-dependent Clp protease, ATP-binding subunit ClpC / Negative regulator of genetic competence clcC/mecB [Nocardiopsis sp. JB363]
MPENRPCRPELSPAALRAVELAGCEAMALRHPFLGTEHLVIGVAGQAEETGRRTALEPAPHLLRREVVRLIAPGGDPCEQAPTFTPRVRAVLRLARAEARRRGQPHLGIHHLAWGLVSVEGGTALRVLRKLDVDLSDTRERARAYLDRETIEGAL